MNISNPHGLSFDFLDNGLVRSIKAEPVRISLKASTPWSMAGTNLYLRKRNEPSGFTALLGIGSRFLAENNTGYFKGNWGGVDFECTLQLSSKSYSWQWRVELKNTDEAAEFDLIYVQDVGLKGINDGLVNEYYVSQYLERIVLEDEKHGPVICCRQNMKEAAGHPWLMLSCTSGADSAATDGMQFFGKTFRETGIPEGMLQKSLGGNCAGESPIVALQSKPVILAKSETKSVIFAAVYKPDHPLATSADDLKMLSDIEAEFSKAEFQFGTSTFSDTQRNIFHDSPFLQSEDLNEDELFRFFGNERRHAEIVNGRLLSFFSGSSNHVMLREKELLCDRPHAHIMQANTGMVPDENIISTTAFAFGVFNSHISQGNTNFGVLLSVCTSQFNQDPYTGQRIFVETFEGRFLLGVPSAFEMGLNHCRWIYKSKGKLWQVRTWTSPDQPFVNMDFSVLQGGEVNLVITHDFDKLNEWVVEQGSSKTTFIARPSAGSMLAGKFPNARFRIVVNSHNDFVAESTGETGMSGNAGGLFTVRVKKSTHFCMTFIGETQKQANHVVTGTSDTWFQADAAEAKTFWEKLSLGLKIGSSHQDISAIREILPWYGMNALIHFLTPYGLEQFSGAAWGTRDVSQGPIELLITLGKYAEARKVLLTIFANQNPDGGWPQWWMFDSFDSIRAGDSHGDVFYWVIIALANYIRVTGDLTILKEEIPYFEKREEIPSVKTPVSEHVDRLIAMITASFISGTSLVPFGGGDWNDSLQPVNEELAHRLISSWTVEMNYQAFAQYKQVFELSGEREKADLLSKICDSIKSDFNKHLVKDGIVAGYGLVEDDGNISVLLHPSDQKTGIQYSLLPMERGIISGLFTKEQALLHRDLIEKHLKGPDGARLMDRPLRYKGGIQEIFQRAESSTFFGREIGLMYVHEHIRYAELLARLGDAKAFVKAMRQAKPVDYKNIVSCADYRQANCYYSSSDVTFATRYEADEKYADVIAGKYPLKGGWRVYSSGPGIYLGIVITKLLGFRNESGTIVFDPVMLKEMDGLVAEIAYGNNSLSLSYHVVNNTHSPERITVNGSELEFSREANPYRTGGAVIDKELFESFLVPGENIVEIWM